MAVSQPTGPGSVRSPSAKLREWLRSASRYDFALAVIPVAFLLATATHALAAIPRSVSLGVAALVGLVVLADALFLHPPRDSPPR